MRFLHSKSPGEKLGIVVQISPTPLAREEVKTEELVVPKSGHENKEANVEKNLENGDAQSSPVVEDNYAHGVKLATITVCVALSILLVALVGPHFYCHTQKIDNTNTLTSNRTTPLLQQPSPESQMTFTR